MLLGSIVIVQQLSKLQIDIIEEQSQGKHQSQQILSNDEYGLSRQSRNDDLATVFAYHIAGIFNYLLEFNASQVSCKTGNKAIQLSVQEH